MICGVAGMNALMAPMGPLAPMTYIATRKHIMTTGTASRGFTLSCSFACYLHTVVDARRDGVFEKLSGANGAIK